MKNFINATHKTGLLLVVFLLATTNSCQKWTPALDTGKINLADDQKVQPREVTSWISNNLSAGNQAQVQLSSARQNVINYQHVVRISVGVNAALFFTKSLGILQVYAYKWLDLKPGEKLFTGYITEYSFQTNTAAQFVYQDSKVTTRSGLMLGASGGLTAAKNRMKITTGTTRSGDISSIFGQFWCWLTGGTWYNGDDGDGGADGEVSQGGCNYASVQQNNDGGGDPSGDYTQSDNTFIPTTTSPDGSIPPDPSPGYVSVYTPPDPNAGCGFDANGDQVLTNDGSCQGQWTTFQLFPPVTDSDLANATFADDGKPGIDPNKYINCFSDGKTASGYKLTIYVTQPVPGSNDQWSPNVIIVPMGGVPGGETFITPGGNPLNVGHTFVGFEKDNTDGTSVKQVMGFYPGPGLSVNPKGVIKDDSGHPYNVS